MVMMEVDDEAAQMAIEHSDVVVDTEELLSPRRRLALRSDDKPTEGIWFPIIEASSAIRCREDRPVHDLAVWVTNKQPVLAGDQPTAILRRRHRANPPRKLDTLLDMDGSIKINIIPDSAELLISMGSFDDGVRTRALAAIERIALGESIAAGVPREATVEVYESSPPSATILPRPCALTRRLPPASARST